MITKNSSLDVLNAKLAQIPGMSEAIAEERAALRAARLVREIRENANMSQRTLANRLNVSQARISQIENGVGRDGLSIALLERIATACGGYIAFHFERAGNKTMTSGAR